MNRPLDVRQQIVEILRDRYGEGRIHRRFYREREKIAIEAGTVIGDQVPDSAKGNERIVSWLGTYLMEHAT